jgi:hypothetical protein
MVTKKENKAVKSMSVGMALGIAIGVGIGAALGNIGMGIAIGVGIGVALGAGLGAAFQAKKGKDRDVELVVAAVGATRHGPRRSFPGALSRLDTSISAGFIARG